MKKRWQIRKAIRSRQERINKLKAEIKELTREDYLLSDKKQWFVEKEEDVLISGRPKITEKHLIGRVHWFEYFYDEDLPKTKKNAIKIERSCNVRQDGKWLD